MIRVLHIMACADAGGISSVVKNYYQFIDRSKIHFDIGLTVPEAGQNARALEQMGAKIFFLPLKSEDMEGFRRELTRLLTEGKYDALHVHESETCYVALKIARELGIPCRIAHAHTCSPYEGIRGVVRRLSGCVLNYPYATHVIACGQKAGDRVFGKINMKRKKALVLPNAVDTQKFRFSQEVRDQVRQELQLEGKLVIGMVSRLSEEKNVPFALRLLPLIQKKNPNAVLVIAGNGPDEEKIRALAQELSLGDSVRLLGRRPDAHRLYQAYDLLLMPSFTEGFPVVAVEAMSSGLPVILSDAITGELSFGSAVTYLPLSKPDRWAETVEKWKKDSGRAARQHEIPDHGLDIRSCAGILTEIYEEDTKTGK